MENMPMSLRALQHEHQFIVNTFASTMQLLARGPGEKPECFFDTLRSILFYLDEFPEQLHHRFESQILFPALIQENSSFTQVIKKLDVDHQSSEQEIRRLQHLLLGWEIMGDARRIQFEDSCRVFVNQYLDHIDTEEKEIFPAVLQCIPLEKLKKVDTAFAEQRRLHASSIQDSGYARLLTRIAMHIRHLSV
jgi:hemerythrin-like domain-containing protein